MAVGTSTPNWAINVTLGPEHLKAIRDARDTLEKLVKISPLISPNTGLIRCLDDLDEVIDRMSDKVGVFRVRGEAA